MLTHLFAILAGVPPIHVSPVTPMLPSYGREPCVSPPYCDTVRTHPPAPQIRSCVPFGTRFSTLGGPASGCCESVTPTSAARCKVLMCIPPIVDRRARASPPCAGDPPSNSFPCPSPYVLSAPLCRRLGKPGGPNRWNKLRMPPRYSM